MRNCATIFIIAVLLLTPVLVASEESSTTRAGVTSSGDLESLRKQILGLQAELQRLGTLLKQAQASDSLLATIISDIEYLKAENSALRGSDGMTDQQLASTEPAVMPTVEQIAVPATEETSGGLEISGFFDVVGSDRRAARDETQFGLGQAEIDLASKLGDKVDVEAAVAYNNETGTFELGAAIIALHVFNGEGDHLRPTFGIDHSFILAGQFDAPFGIDYHTYASIDRKLVTAPSVVDLTHGGWNDYGVQFGLESSHGNLVCYWVNGFESSAEILNETQTLATGVEVYDQIDTSPANAFGTRLGLKPFGWLELGGSLAGGWNASGEDEMTLAGADVQLVLNRLEVKSEYISHSLNRSIAEENNRGYYAQAIYTVLTNAFVAVRYGSFKPDGAEWIGQGSLGLGYILTDGVELRWESLIHQTSDENQNFLQVVAGF